MHNQYREEIRNNVNYLETLALIGSLSDLFAESDIPYIHYRVTENLFCKCFNAENLSRYDDSYDAKKWDAGIGIKTFILPGTDYSLQKVAEFDSLSSQLSGRCTEEAARKVANWRNQRIEAADMAHAITKPSIYHIIARKKGMLKLFVVGYDKIRVNTMHIIGQSPAGFAFSDGLHDYNFNRAKSTLLEKFILTEEHHVVNIPVSINHSPLEMLKQLRDNPLLENVIKIENKSNAQGLPILTVDDSPIKQSSVILPLFSTREGGTVPLKSGLNQWNAGGRSRDHNEIYIPVPAQVHIKNPTFFPERDVPFILKLPNGTSLSAKMCQQGRKGLMSNPNKALGQWLLRDVLKIPVGHLVTRDILNTCGYDSVIIIKETNSTYRIELSKEAHYREYNNLYTL